MRKFITRSFVLAAAVSSIAVASVIGPASHGGTLADDSNANNPKRPVLADDSNANNPKRPVLADDSNANNPKRPVLADDSNANNPKRPVIALA